MLGKVFVIGGVSPFSLFKSDCFGLVLPENTLISSGTIVVETSSSSDSSDWNSFGWTIICKT